ncbi:MAG: DUF2341 domain-containing protein [Bacteroidia bacterium]|nr:DUF2341 domain-containing protein [Bacteroidia bacterium]
MAQKLVTRNRPRLKNRQVFNRAVLGVTFAYLTTLGLIFYFNSYTTDMKADALSGYKFRKVIAIDSSFVMGDKNIKNFKFLVQHRDADLKHVSYGGHVEDINGNDIRFTDIDGKNELHFEIETYNENSGEITAWVNVPILYHNQTTKLFMYYGNPISLGNSNTQPWESEYKAVYHLNKNTADASSYTNDATNKGSKICDGKFGKAFQFDGVDDYLAINYASELSINDSVTVSAWVKPTEMMYKKWHCIIGKQYGETYEDNLFLGINGKDKASAFFTYDCGVQGNKNELNPREWYHFAATSKGNLRVLYINGIEIRRHKKCRGPWLKDINPMSIGAQENSEKAKEFSDFFYGIIDEVRVQNAFMSAETIKTEFYNYSSPSRFYIYGKEEQFSTSTVQLLYFKSEMLKENTIMVEWATATELNNQDFKVLRKNKTGEFVEIETVLAGKGNELETYKVIDTNPMPGKNQYKLVQQSTDGQLSSYGPISVENDFNNKVIGDLRLMSSPGNKKVNLHFNCSTSDEMHVTLKGLNGETILTKDINTESGLNNIELDTTGMLENGLYVAKFTGNNIKPITAKVVKF